MGVPQKAVAWITAPEYLALEERASSKHEYLDGVIYAWQGHAPEAMARGSRRHNAICRNLAVTLRQRLGATLCQVFMSDVRLHVVARVAYFYPDVAVTCSAQDLDDDASNQSEFREPVLIAEVLSESTERFDRGEKFSVYQQIAALQEYVLLSTGGRKVEVFRKQGSGEWIGSVYLAGALTLESLGIETSVEALYDSVEFR